MSLRVSWKVRQDLAPQPHTPASMSLSFLRWHVTYTVVLHLCTSTSAHPQNGFCLSLAMCSYRILNFCFLTVKRGPETWIREFSFQEKGICKLLPKLRHHHRNKEEKREITWERRYSPDSLINGILWLFTWNHFNLKTTLAFFPSILFTCSV